MAEEIPTTAPVAVVDVTMAHPYPAAYETMDILDVLEPSAQRQAEMRMAAMSPSEWLRLLCRDWSLAPENDAIASSTDARFLQYKSYLKGRLTSQLLCRLSISGTEGLVYEGGSSPCASSIGMGAYALDFWKILGVDDEFDRAHIVANVERFCSLYNIRGGTLDELPAAAVGPRGDVGIGIADGDNATTAYMGGSSNHYFSDALHDPAAAAAAAAVAGMGGNDCALLFPVDPIAAAQALVSATKQQQQPHANNNHINAIDHRCRHDVDDAFLPHRPPNDAFPPGIAAAKLITAKTQTSEAKIHQRRLKAEQRHREREAYSLRKAEEKAVRLATREERRQRKLDMRKRREEFAQQQKEAALRRAAELVRSNRIPIEITRGAAAAQAAANAAVANCAVPAAEAAAEAVLERRAPAPMPDRPVPQAAPVRRGRSSIVISTASDLDQIVTHSNNLWAKYNAIAKEHNQKVNWIVVAKELGIHVKVREKYARMHARARARGFDFVNWGGKRIKDYPQYFLDPLGPNNSSGGAGAMGSEGMAAGEGMPARIEEFGKPQAAAAALLQHQQHGEMAVHVPARIEEAGKGRASTEVMEASVPMLPQVQQQRHHPASGSVPCIPPNPLLRAAEAAFAEAGYAGNQPAVIAPLAQADAAAMPQHRHHHDNPLLQAAEAAFAEAGYPSDQQPAVIAPAVVQENQFPTEISGDEAQHLVGNAAV